MIRPVAWPQCRSRALPEKLKRGFDDPVQVLLDADPQGQANQPVGDVRGDGQFASSASHLATPGRGMQRYVVKHALYAQPLHVLDERGSLAEVSQQQVIHVGVVAATLPKDRATHATCALQGSKGLVI